MLITYEWSDWRNGQFWWIQSVYVHKEFRRQGVFKEMYEFIKTKSEADNQCVGLRLYVEKENSRAQNTYEKMGMTKTDYFLYSWSKQGM